MNSSKYYLWIGAVLTVLIPSFGSCDDSGSIWSYECKNTKCIRELHKDASKATSLSVCRIFCGTDPGTIWPKPTGPVRLNSDISRLKVHGLNFFATAFPEHTNFWHKNYERLVKQIHSRIPENGVLNEASAKYLQIYIQVLSLEIKQTLDSDESYRINGKDFEDHINVTITAKTIYGARHGLETLTQLIVFDPIRSELVMPSNFDIEDAPVYKHRGLLLDTSRNYFKPKSIKRLIDGMAMVKLNTFHWHITDSQSFPLVLKSHPELARLGAYSPEKVYTAEDISDILDYAHYRGVRVIPEFDAPAHVGEGWQEKNLLSCFNYQPWQKYCVEPPCGQFDPSKENLYPILEDIYREMYELFRQPDVFHMGGDEVSHSCWNSSSDIHTFMKEKGWPLTEMGFMKLWGYFQDRALNRLDSVTGNDKLPVIMWTSRLTDVPYIDQFLSNFRYIIQIWTTGTDPKITDLLNRGYKLIISNYDALYLDCGFGAWVNNGVNWCSPYIGWEKVYNNNLDIMAGEYKSLIMGAEAALWSEEADDQTLDGRFWPRASALAERLWSNPSTTWRDAEPRMLIHRERLVESGIAAESLQPQWCLQHEGDCPIKMEMPNEMDV